MEDNVNHPQHYTSHPSGVECIEIAEHYDMCIGSAIKYLWRAGLKQEQGRFSLEKEMEDLSKAIWYIKRKRELLQVLLDKENLKASKIILEELIKEVKENPQQPNT